MADKSFFDEARIYVQAGRGGNGCCSFRREKFIPKGGPDGGNGGNGGDIVFITKTNMNTLLNYHYNIHYRAENGKSGSGQNRTGANGKDKELFVPIGTQIFDVDENILFADLCKEGDRYVLAHGGTGGIGNMAFKTSVNQAPRKATKGLDGESGWFKLKLKMLSDVGIVGLPNAGKSSIISILTNAKSAVGDYSFTTLKPILGVLKKGRGRIVICDIPGLIENASKGAGLGDKFLKHIERCSTLLWVIDVSSNDFLRDYEVIKNELQQFNKNILQKHIIVVFNKIDLISEKSLKDKMFAFKKKTKITPVCISTLTRVGMQELVKILFKVVKNG